MKLSPSGVLPWSTLIGGAGNDLLLSIALDSDGYVYVTGVGGEQFPTTAGSFQPVFHGYSLSSLGRTNAVILKLSPDGSTLIWGSYFGSAYQIRDLAVTDQGEICVASEYRVRDGQPPFPAFSAPWFANAFQPTPQGSDDIVVAKLASTGERVLWATYVGGSGWEQPEASIAVDGIGNVYVAGLTKSEDIPTPNGAFPQYRGGGDGYLAKLSADGSRMLWGTYLGGSALDGALGKHAVAVDHAGHVYVASDTESPDFPVTLGAVQPTYAGNAAGGWDRRGDYAITKLTTDGRLLASTYFGGRFRDSGEGIALDNSGNVYLTGFSFSDDIPATAGAYQTTYSALSDGFLFKLSADLDRLLYCSYFGTTLGDSLRAVAIGPDGTWWAAGTTESSAWYTLRPFQRQFAGRTDVTIIKFSPP